ILWGPPGCGKTTLARIIAGRTRADYVPFSAVVSGIKEVRAVMEGAARRFGSGGRRTLLFIDEIHRFNRSQQDAFLPYVEDGTILLIGATTENPSFEINSPLLSRSRVYRLERLSEEEILTLLRRALGDRDRGLGHLDVDFPDELLRVVAEQSQGDARAALSALELVAEAAAAAGGAVTRDGLVDALQKTTLYYDRAGEEHFNLISALHKSMRNSDPDATLYWLARMLAAGEDPLYVARRIARFASEDVGLADPRALELAIAAKEAVHFIGLPEGKLALAEAAVYCALAPKSNALYAAFAEAERAIDEGAHDPVPFAIRNAVTGLMKREGYGAGYRYAHDHDDAITDLDCLPQRLAGRRFYRPTARGFEKTLSERIDAWLDARRRLKDRSE
ncbi:MAG TPA: replication-associated recombination protein A, partial [Candidatus Polarisedimenticolaceae bacterium]|nr:replication-associated recombination protein A [Candidatus Polarisedimenticolaceae bacterium]